MKKTKEVKPILTAIFCLNRIKRENEDEDISLILDYAFRTFFGANTNLLTLCCMADAEQVKQEVSDLLEQETNYNKYLEEYNKK